MRLSKPKVDDIINIVERWPKQKKKQYSVQTDSFKRQCHEMFNTFLFSQKTLQDLGMNKRNLQTDFPKWFDFAKIFNEMHVSAYSLSLSGNARQ